MPQEPASDEVTRVEERLHIMEALATALADPHTVLDLVLGASDSVTARKALEKRFAFDAVQADAVLQMQFRQAAQQHRAAIEGARREDLGLLDALRNGTGAPVEAES